MDKLDKLYNLYLSNGLISKATPIDKFKAASDEQRAKLYELGKSSGLFATTDLNTFSSAWGGLSIDKKKEDSALPSMEEGTSLATPKMESPKPSVSSPIKQVKNPSSFNKNIESSDYQRHTKLASVAINAADKGDKQTLINTLKEMNAIRAMYPAGVFESDKQMTEDLQSIEKVAGRKKLDVDIKTATRMPVSQPKIELKLPKGTKIETSDIKYTPEELKASVRADLIELDAMDEEKASKQVEEEFAQDGIFDKALGMINKWTVGKGWGYIPNETERAIAKATNEVKANNPDATAEEILEYAKEQRKKQILDTQKDKAVEDYFEGKSIFGRPEEQIKMEQALEGVKNKQEYHIAKFNEKQSEIDQNIATLELYKKKIENKEDLTQEDVNNVNYAINKVNLLYDDLKKNYSNIESDEKDLKDVNEELDRFKRNYSYLTNAGARVGAAAIDIASGIAGFVDMQNSLLMGGLKDATGIDVSKANIFDDISEGLSGTSKSIRESIAKNDELKNVNSISEFGEWAGQLVLDQAPQIVMAMATGGASIPLMGASAAGSKFEELKDNEAYTMGQKVMASYAVGLAEALSEKIELDVIKYAFPSSRLAKAAAKTKADEEILRQSLRTGIKGATINNIEKLGMATLNVNKEGISEVVAQLGSNITDRYILDNKDVSVLDGISDAYLSGAVIGGAMIAAPALASKIVSPFVYDPNKEVSKNVSKISELTKALDVATKDSDKKIIQGQIDKLNKDNFNIVDLAINRTKVLSPDEIREGVKAVERMQEIKSQVADIKGNPVYTKEQKQALLGGLVDEYNQLVLKRKQLIDKANAVQEQTTSEVPIQPEARVGEEVAQGKPQAEPQVVTEEGVQEEVKEFEPSKAYEKIDEDGFPVVAYTDSETGQTEFETSEIPQISASKTIGGSIAGLFSMLRGTGQPKNKKISIYQIEENPSVEIQPSNIADFAFLQEVRYNNKVKGKKILEINLNNNQVEFLNDFYESFSASEEEYDSLLKKYNVEDRQALEDLFKEKINSLIPSNKKGFFRAEVSTQPQVVTEEGVQEIKIDRPSIVSNVKSEVDTVVAATPETETGQTFNIDGTVYSNGGLVVPVVSENLTQEELTSERIADFVEANRDKIGANAVKVGIYKFPNSNQVSIDLNIVVPKNNRKAALEFARLAGQESLFDLDTFENVKTGSDGKNPMQFSSAQFVEISKALEEGRMPEVFETVQQPAAQTIKETDENYQESRDAVMQIAQEQDEFVPGDAVLEQVTTDANGNVTGGTVSFLDADRNKTTKTISREQKERVAEQRQPQASDKAKITENVKKAIAKLFPKLDSKTFRSAEAMREYARGKYGDEIADQIQDDDAARVLIGKDNMPVAILVNEEFSDETTFPHEAWHPILLKAFGDNQKLFGEFRDSIRKALIDNGYKDIADKLDAFANQKEYKDTGVVAEEWLAQFGGMLTSAGIDTKKLTKKQKSLLSQIKDIVNKFAVRIAGQPVFLENATPDTILDFMVSLSDMMARGEDISGLITEEAGATFGPADVQVDVTRAKKKTFKNNKYEVKQPVYKPEGGKATGFTFIADRMATGEWNGLDPKSGIKIKLMGGIGYPMLKGMYKKAGWAVEGGTVMSTFLRKIVNSKTGIGFPVLMSEYAHVSNLTFAKIFEAEMDWMVKSGQITQEQQLENVNKYISDALIASKDLSPKMKPDPKSGKMMDKNANAPLRTFAIESDGKYTPKVYTSMDQLYKDLEGTFDARGLFMKTLIGAGVKNRYAKIEKYGFPDMVRVADEVSDPRLKGIPSGTSVSAIQFNKEKASEFVKDIESGAKLSEKHSAKSVGVEEHISYQYPVEGESLGWLPGVIDISTAEGMDPEVKKWFEDQRKKFEKGEISEAQLRSNVTSKARASMPEVELKTKAQKVERVQKETNFVPVSFWVQALKGNVTYLDNVIEHILEAREILKKGEVPKKMTTKSYLITLASMGSGGGYYENWKSKTGKSVDEIFIEKQNGRDWLRPEGAAAAYLSTQEGKDLVSNINNGTATKEEIKALFDFVGTGRESSKAEYVVSTMQSDGISNMTDLFNSNKGSDFSELFAGAIKNLKGIGEGKTGFFNQYFGVSSRGVVDARQMNAWTAGSMKLTDEQKKLKKKIESSPALQQELLSRIEEVGIELGYPEDLAAYIAHHAIWDGIANNITKHEGEYIVTRAQKTIQQANEDFGTEDGEAVFGTRAQKIDNKELSKLSNEISSKVENKDLVELKSLINDVESPKKTIKAYKLFKVKKGFPGELFPLFVGANESVTVGEWIEAKAGELTQTKEGKTMVKSTLGPLAYRPGWHSGDIAVATHIGSKKNASDKAPTLRAEDQVWAEVEVGNDFDWQKEANNRAEKTKDGKINLRTAHITDQIPSKGFYKYKTNSNMTGSWIISGEMKVNRVLTEKEVEEINKKANAKDLPRLAPFDYEAYGFNEDGSVKNQKQVISNQVARAYIIAKETGENPDLVKAVEGKITTRAQKKEVEATDRDFVLPFGKYEGKWFTTTPPAYRDWLTSQPWFNIKKYLKPKEQTVTTKAQKAPTHVPDSVYKYLTEDGNGNIVFHHYSRERRDMIRPSTGSGSLLTSREEAQALSSVGGLGMYYAQLGQKEPGVGDERHTVLVPKEKIYYMTTDPLNLYDEARARFMDYMNRNNDIQIEYAFSPNYQVAWITKVAQEKGFDMVISKWKNDADYRAQSAIPLKPIKEDIQMKATDENIEVGDKVFVYGAPAVILDIDADGIATYKSANSSGKFDIPYSEKSMRYGKMTLLEKGPFEMDENMEIVLKTRGQKSSYDRMIEELDGVIQKSIERKVSKEKVYQNALAYLQGSKVYEQADDIEREKMVRDLRKKLGLKEKSVARIFSLKRKEPGITINEMQALRDQMRLETKAAKDAIQVRQRIAAMIKDQLSGLFKKGVIKTQQLQAITRKILQLNFLNQDHVDNFINYMDKVFRDAEYADKLAKANTLQSRIKRAVKDKTIQAETRDTAKEFVKLAPYLAADIDAYLAVAEEVYEAVQQTKGTVTEGIASVTFKKAMNYESVQDYTKKEAAAQEEIRKQQVLDKNAYLVESGVLDENMSLKEIMAIIQSIEANPEKQVDKEKEKTIRDYVNKYFNSYRTILEEIIRTDIDPFTGERMYLTDAQRSQVKKFLAVDLDVLSLKDAYHMVNAIDNFVMNQNTDGMEATIAAYKGIDNIEEAKRIGLVARPLRFYWSGLLGRKWGEQFEQITMMHERLFGGVERALMFDRLSGLSKLLRDKIIALKQHNAVVEKYSTEFGKIKDFNKAENVFERGMLGIVARNVQGSAIEQQEEFNKQKKNIRISINAMKQGTDKQKKEAVVAQQVYDKILKDSNSYQEARSKANANNVRAVEFWQNEFADIFDALQDVSRGVYNTILDRDVNYLPHTYKRFEKKGDSMDVSEDGSAFMGVNEGFDMKETGVLMKATKPRLTENGIPARILSFDFESNMSRAMQGALIDINTASTIRQISAFYNSEEFARLIPSKEDRDLARDRMRKFIKKTKRKQYVQEDNLDALARAANYISSFSAGRALGSMSQIPKQTISVAANTMINTGGNIAIFDVFSAKDFIDKSGYAISIRGIASQADIQTINQILKKAEESKGKQALDYLKKLNDMYLELFVANPDVFIARASWLAYYKKKLNKLGVDTNEIDWSTHEINTEAADYAQRMTDRQQNFSDADLAGEIMSNQKPIVQLLRKSLFPFASFGINKRAQLIGDMSVLYNPLSSSEDKKLAVRSLASWGVEFGVYAAVRIFIGNVLYDFFANLMADYEEDDEEKKKKITKALQYETKNAFVELFSPIPNVADDALVDGINSTLNTIGIDEKYRLPEGKGEKLYEKVGLTNIMKQKFANLGRMTYAGATGTYVDKFGNEKEMSKEDQERAASMAAVYAFYTLGFVPADIGMTIDKAYYKLGKKSGGKKKSSFGSIDTKIK